ncbi:MAG TPA: CDP-glycerol glycerophosphotransferase family protein [Candidatus Ruania gallistercoris]|uniref:CDP-glycerol glycerophosphotransferase family protein n=1 Tax=Candidatus Ruania gallistercoris TaxID=2838746 RepID=A0A9D2EGK7_9MICO|nr:CDP-glycerol glycerophosphotransferase family protein [Candidatus Ruania gallistercoris]
MTFFGDTTLVLTVGGPRQATLRWLEQLRSDEELAAVQLIVAHHPHADPILSQMRVLAPEAEFVPLPLDEGQDRLATAQAYEQIFAAVRTTYVALAECRRRSRHPLDTLRDQLVRSHARVTSIELSMTAACLLYTKLDRSTPTRAYIRFVLGRGESGQPLTDYLGYLALMTGTNSLEGVDPASAETAIDIQARVAIGRFNSAAAPPWRYRVAIAGRRGVVHEQAAAQVRERVSNQGVLRWENLRARLPLDAVPEGNHLILVGLDTEYEALRVLRPLRPRPGALAAARTMLLADASSQQQTRYLVHTIRSAAQTWITVQHGVGTEARRRWYRTMVRKDLRAVLRSRSAGKRMRLARLVRLVTAGLMRRRDIWLIGERADTAQDNGYHLFRHLRTTHPEREVYYIIDKSSPHYRRVRELGHVVRHSSLRHQFLMLHANMLANAYSIKHMIPQQWNPAGYSRHLAWRVGAVRVYLKHGVHVSANAVKRGTGGYDLYLTVNPMETAALRESSGYDRQVVETGMPRYDALVPGPRTRTVWFMPTWRRYLVPKLFSGMDAALVPFEGSTYETFLRSFLGSPRLHELLERYDYRLQFLPHYNLRELLTSFPLTSPRTTIADTDRTPFQDLIRGCDLFVTDHSSVHFDVAYVGTPIIYTHFDADEYAEGHASKSWFEHVRDGFGPVVYTLEETLDALEEVLARDCAPDPFYAARVDAAFTYRDQDNCKRVVQVVEDLLQRSAVNP